MADFALQFSSDERLFVAGKTGSGKTTFVRELARPIPRLIVCDSKGTIQFDPEWQLVDWTERGVRALLAGDDARLRVPAPRDGDWRPFLDVAYQAGDLTIYFDEMYHVAGVGRRPSDELSALYTRGREFRIGTWACSQRPVWVPLFALSEAEWLVTFRLMLPDDRRRMAEICGQAVEEPIPGSDPYGCWVYNQLWDEPYYLPGLDLAAA